MLTSHAATTAIRPPAAPEVLHERPAYRPFEASVARVSALSPNFVRITFRGEQLAGFGTAGLDQRVKVVLPLESGFTHFPRTGEWYSQWRALPERQRNPFRTYTVRAVRPAQCEVDIDFVAHGTAGPASAWALNARPGDPIVLVGPDETSIGRTIGIDWRPGMVSTVLLAGDETAAPAIGAILASLPADARGCALIEVPTPADELELVTPEAVEVRWLPRGRGIPHGGALIPAVRDWTARRLRAGIDQPPLEEIDVDRELLWDVPEGLSLDGEFYAWLAGEASVIKTLRRFLVAEAGLDRRSVAFMGYWRQGRSELD
ncbi:siderophore-interacting protein [Rathayibacter sp. YIM 133350]|uniref:siderophore-interacting protein n=1 Tax=Rathayibacter sp. YIM 133350 TaxID=3131992 RepID=UPI00307FAB2D